MNFKYNLSQKPKALNINDFKDEDLFDAKMNYYNNFGRFLGIKNSIFSIFKVLDLDEVPFPGAIKIKYDGGWGNKCEMDLPVNATWADIWLCADQLIEKSTDLHHNFLESVEEVKKSDGLCLTFYCGS